MNDDAEQTPKAPIPTPVAPSPRVFARPGGSAPESAAEQDATEQDATEQDAPVDGAGSRFASTGDPQVDRALGQLPDPEEHRREATGPAREDDPHEDPGADPDGNDVRGDSDHQGTEPGIDLPDPGLLDAHLAEVTSVHRQLQQRLSDLSG